MDFNLFNQKDTQKKDKNKKEGPKFSGSIAGTLLIFMLITAFYLVISGTSKNIPEVPVSDLARSVSSGEVKKILVEGENLTITYQNDEIKKAKKEAESSLSQTLFNYGVKSEMLANTEIEVKNESGFGYWLINILPFLSSNSGFEKFIAPFRLSKCFSAARN